ncbi:hypothetical protein COCMIDRAFT_106481 [Bipolaris oryzae ATCC 44560]|uniref:Uncharacterized protein n=1 Tax=Bipolaris oryzae ATCC 44560 TaxID=930090 RepID=W6ZC66_COCMI|nr:uncharacterized protein COCMIDRAFT_106481 [Bipolaris oryzae ATCC 44560]EUC41321.1 hypothetical protein COCMIDRAFT_106481 [Bipolaris oryzae ATCC 44560]
MVVILRLKWRRVTSPARLGAKMAQSVFYSYLDVRPTSSFAHLTQNPVHPSSIPSEKGAYVVTFKDQVFKQKRPLRRAHANWQYCTLLTMPLGSHQSTYYGFLFSKCIAQYVDHISHGRTRRPRFRGSSVAPSLV